MPAVPDLRARGGPALALGKLRGTETRFLPRLSGGINTNARYWVGGTGSWDASGTTHWSTTSGGAAGASVPTAANDVIFDANSGTGTVSVSATATARSINCTGYAGTLSVLAGIAVQIGDSQGGSLIISSAMTLTAGSAASNFQFVSTNSNSGTGWVVDMAGKSWIGAMTFNGVGGSWKFTNGFTMSSTLTLTAGTLDMNNQSITLLGTSAFSSTGSLARTLRMGTAVVLCTAGTWITSGSNMTVDAVNSLVGFTGASCSFTTSATGNIAYGAVRMLPSAGPAMNQVTCSVGTIDTLVLGAVTAHDVFPIHSSLTITNSFTATGLASGAPALVAAGVHGTANTITAGSAVLSDVIFMDITAAGAAGPFTGTRLGNGGGNTNITFGAGQTNYWVGGSGSWSDVNHWASTDGGTGGTGRVPLAHDHVRVTANSGAGTITSDRGYYGTNIDFTGSSITTWTLLASQSSLAPFQFIWGNLDVPTSVTITGTNVNSNRKFVFAGRGAQTVDLHGGSINWESGSFASNMAISFSSPGGSYTLSSDFVTIHDLVFGYALNGGSVSVSPMTLNFNNKNVTVRTLTDSMTTAVRTLALGNGTIKLTGTTTATGSVVAITIPNQANLTITGSPSWVIPETMDGVVSGGKYRIPQAGSDRTSIPVISEFVPTNGWGCSDPAVSLSSDLDLIVRVALDQWINANNPNLLSQWCALPASSRSWNFYNQNGALVFQGSLDGSTTAITAASNALLSFTDGAIGWVRVTRNRSAGEVKFYYCPDQTTVPTAGQWIQLGTTQTGFSTGALFSSPGDVFIGATPGNVPTAMKGVTYYYAQVSDTIGGAAVASIDFTTMADYSLSYADPQGNTWVNYQASTSSSRRVLGGAARGPTATTGNSWFTPDSAAVSITGDLELQFRGKHWNYFAGTGHLIGKATASGTAVSYHLQISGGNGLVLTLSANGTAITQATVGATLSSLGLTSGVAYWFKATWRQSDGRVQFWYAADSVSVPTVWTQLGTDKTIAIASISDGTANLEVGHCFNGSSSPWIGDIYRARVLNGIGGTVVFDADFTGLRDDTFAFAESSSNAAIVHHSNATNPTAQRNVVQLDITGKTVPGTLTATPSGRVLYLHALSSGTVPSVSITGPKWITSSQGLTTVVPSFTFVGSSTGPRSALYTNAESSNATISSSGTVDVRYVDIYKSTAAGTSSPFVARAGFDAGSNVNWLFGLIVTPTLTDSLGETDALALTNTTALSSSDTVGASDAITQSARRPVDDLLGELDSLTYSVRKPLEDSEGILDAQEYIPTKAVQVDDTGGATDGQNFRATKVLEDGAGLTDSTTPTITRALIDTVQLSELGSEIFTDDFDRADGALGGSWTLFHDTGGTDWRIDNNGAVGSGTAVAYAAYETRPFGVDVRATLLADAIASPQHPGLALDLYWDGSGIYYQAALIEYGGYLILLNSYGTLVGLVLSAAGQRLRLTDDGVTVTGYVDGVVLNSFAHNPDYESGRHGFVSFGFGIPADEFTDHAGDPFTDHAGDPFVSH